MFGAFQHKDSGGPYEIPSLAGIPLDLESKFSSKTGEIEGYASLFGETDQGGDVILAGAYSASLRRLKAQSRNVKMLWQHNPGSPIGVWDEVTEDKKGLYVKGRILPSLELGREAIELIEAKAIDGMSIGYRTIKARTDNKGNRLLEEVELWEVSIVTFPMLPSARIDSLKEQPNRADDAMYLPVRAVEAYLRDERGLSWSQAKSAVVEIKNRAARDGGEDDETAALVADIRKMRAKLRNK